MSKHQRSQTAITVIAAAVLSSLVATGCWSSAQAWLRPNYSQIEEGLYLGGQVDAPPPGTHAVLNVSQKPDRYQAPVHHWEPIPDGPPPPSLDWLRRQVDFVTAQRKLGRVVYVHCRVGVSRSGMVVVAYEMAKNDWTFEQALAFVRARRSIVNPNPAFRPLLREWERIVKTRAPVSGPSAPA